jgi:non-specific serine/threonine protein kinase
MRKGPGADDSRIEGERDNLLAALAWAVDRDPEKAAALVGTLVQEATVLVGVDEARRALRGVLDRCRPDTAHYARAVNAAALLAALQHDLEEATTLTDRAAAVAQTLDYQEGIGWGEVTRFVVSVLSGRRDDASVHAGRALDLFERCGNRFGYVRMWIRRASMALLIGCPVVEDDLTRGLEMARETGDSAAQGAALTGVGFCALRQGDRARAVAVFKQAVELEGEDVLQFYLLRLVGLAAAVSRSDPWRAMRLGGAARTLAQRALLSCCPAPVERLLEESREDSRRLIGAEEADRAWHEGTLMTRKEAVEEALRVEPPPESLPEMPGGLTSREFEVAREVAAGRTNREIAEGMHLSVRTIENHVEHALSKLGLNRRTQLAGWMQSLRSPADPGSA